MVGVSTPVHCTKGTLFTRGFCISTLPFFFELESAERDLF